MHAVESLVGIEGIDGVSSRTRHIGRGHRQRGPSDRGPVPARREGFVAGEREAGLPGGKSGRLVGIEEAKSLRADELRVRGRAEDELQDPCHCAADEHVRVAPDRCAMIANIEAREIHRIGRGYRIRHHDVRQAQCTRAGAGAGSARVLGIDAVVECDEMQARLVPEQDRIVAPSEVKTARGLAVRAQVHRPPFALGKVRRIEKAGFALLCPGSEARQPGCCAEAEIEQSTATEAC